MSHSRSSANWFVGAISEDQGVAERAASLPGRVCLNDLHIVHGAVLGVCFHHSNSIHHAYTLTHTAKNGMLAIKPLGGSQGHKELAAVGVRPCIGHRENSSPCEFQVWMKFIFKLLAIDRRTTSTCPCWVTSLDHKVFDDSVEFGAIVVTSTSQFSEVLTGLWSVLPVQLQHDDPHAAGEEDSRAPVKNKVMAHRNVMGPLHKSSFASLLSHEMMIKIRFHAQQRKTTQCK